MVSATKGSPRIRGCLREGSTLLFEDWVRMENDSYSLQDAVAVLSYSMAVQKEGIEVLSWP